LVVVTEPVKVLVQHLEALVVQVAVGFMAAPAGLEQLPKDLMEVVVKAAQYTLQAEAVGLVLPEQAGIVQVVVLAEMV
tara:strand:+ start:379 stop:612 length:234 start_codon:yes stop_codon:yes gene_type:complete